MKDERKTKKQLIAELVELRRRIAELEASATEQALQTKPLRDLIEIIHFTENVAAKIHGLLDEAEIYRVVKEEFAQSKQFSASIVLLTDDGSKLRITVHSVLPSRLKAGEKAARVRIKEFRISLNKSSIYSRVVRDGETIHVSISDIVGELFPRRLANLIVKTTGYEDAFSVLTPLKRHGKIIGALGVSSTDLAEYFIPSVKSLAQHISTALELGDERAEHKRTEERYRDLVEKEKDIIYTLDDKGTITFASPAVEDVLGYGQDELVGENFMVLIPEDLQEKTGADFNALLRTGEITAETTLLDKKGHPHFVEYSSTVIKDGDEVVGTRGIVHDITRRKRAEEALRESEERYRTLYESSRDGIATATLDGRITECNQAYADMLGCSREELQGVRYQELTPSKWQPFNQDIFEKMMKRGYSHEFEKEYVKKDGTVFPVSLRSWRIDDETGNPIGLCSIVRDITERKRAEEELARYRDRLMELVEERTAALMQTNEQLRREITERKLAEEELRAEKAFSENMLNALVDTVFVFDPNTGEPLRWNRAFDEISGYTHEEIASKKAPDDWYDEEDLKRAEAATKRVFLEGQATAELSLITKDGRLIPTEYTGALIRDAEGRPQYIIAVGRDITERKRAEEALELRVRQLAALSRASQVVTASLELDQVLAEIVSLASEVVGSDYTSVVLMDEAGRLGESADNVPGIPAIEYRIRDEGLTRWIVRSRQAAIIDEIGEDGAMTPDLGERAPRFANPPIVEAGVKSLAGLPLMVKDRLLGVLYLHSLRPSAFHGQLPLLTAFVNQAAIAIENARLYESVQRELAERVRAEEALRESEERYRAIFEQAADSIVLIDGETGALAEFNDRAHESLGYTREEFEKLKVPDFEIVESAEEVAKHIETVIKEGADTFETKQRTKSGDVRDVLISVRAISVHGRDLVQGIWRDITERKRAEEALRDSRHMLQTVLDAIPAAVFWKDRDSVYVGGNRTFLEAAGMKSSEELVGKSDYDLPWEKRQADSFREGDRRVMESDIPEYDIIEPYLRADGTHAWAKTNKVPLRDTESNVVGVLGTYEDITERKQAEAALQESEERYRTLLEGVPVGLYRTTPDGQILDANPALVEMLGYPDRESLLAVNAIELYVDPAERAQELALLKREGVVRGFEAQLRRHDGTVIWVQDTARAVRDAEGWALCEGSLEDTTERRRLEEQVRQQERMAAVGQLAGGIAHDFNNYLTTIMLYAQMLLRKPNLPPDLSPSVETVLDESRRAAELVRRILDFSRRSIMETRPVDLASPVQESIDILRRTLPENIRLILEVGPEKYVVNADSTRLQQVVMNLALNARDAMPEGGELRIGLSRIAVRPEEAPPVAEMSTGDWVCLTVSDTGIGMTEEVRSHLFEPFFTTKEPGKGTGLGLAQVYGIVKQHEGCIGVDTDAGQGTTLRIYLPAYREEQMQEVSEEASAPPEGKGEVILLAEDEESVREAGREMLESLGYQVLTAADGRKALEVYKSAERVDLVLMDLVMPEMGGLELIQRLKKTEPQLRALAITGYALTEDLVELKEAGFPDVVYKPFDLDRLARMVRRALDWDDNERKAE